MSQCMKKAEEQNIRVTPAEGVCPIGEIVGKKNAAENRIPVLSCEGACIRGEIARVAANIVAKNGSFSRGCHGELFTVPNSKISEWIKTAGKVVCIDGCFLRCHSRILENIIDPERLLVFDALSFYKKYNDVFDIDDVPEQERKETALKVSQWVIQSIENNDFPVKKSGCCGQD